LPHRLLLVHPHPDDESIACGGVAARAVADGHHVTIVTCTGGEEGENQAGIDLGGRDMASVRRDEMEAALAVLDVDDHRWLGYRDSGMAGEPSNDHPGSFHGAELDEAAGRLASIVREVRPDVVVSDDENGTYGHPDHVKAHHVTERAVALAADEGFVDGRPPWRVPKRYVVTLSRGRMWRMHTMLLAAGLPSPFEGDHGTPEGPDDLPFGTDDGAVTTVVDVAPFLTTKRDAMAAHRSQVGQESFFLNTPSDLAEDAFAEEEFVLVEGEAVPGEDGTEHDLFAGLGT
jgi:N-acetyl-1-D-myo-inositol-2-amino-2-deoxy-alpha-D-glucopyranoside deacetylase